MCALTVMCMFFGASTSCFYPLETELSLKKIVKLGIQNTEIFFNTVSETEEGYLKELKKIADDGGVSIRAVHPFTSFAENFILFTSYERRFIDSADFYKRYYNACNILGCDIVVLHGAKNIKSVCDEEKFQRFGFMSSQAKEFSVFLAQENVVDFSSQSPEYLIGMKNYLGDSFKMVLDVKQAVRSGYNAFEFVKKLGAAIIHIHVSDNKPGYDCLPPGSGMYDLFALKTEMKRLNYRGSWIVELYSNNYTDELEIYNGVKYMQNL